MLIGIANEHEETGLIFDIQRFSIHDGPGIRTLVFLSGCPLRCPWCSNPESWEMKPRLLFNSKICIGCGRCISECPNQAIEFRDNKTVIKRERCTVCGKCAELCPTNALTIKGQYYTVSQAMSEIEKDARFYTSSKGGVTLSGGEPLLQSNFVAALLAECKRVGFNTTIETTGCVPWEELAKTIKDNDLYLYDIKLIDSLMHHKTTGVYNDMIIGNLRKLIKHGKEVIIRVPVIPNHTEDLENLRGIGMLCRELNINTVHLLPYHSYGEGKYELLGQEYRCSGVKHPLDEAMEKWKLFMQEYAPEVIIGG